MSMVNSISSSLNLSGIKLPLIVIERLFNGEVIDNIEKSHIVAFLNYKKLVDYIHAYYNRSDAPFTHAFIKNFNARLLFGTDQAIGAGNYREDNFVPAYKNYEACIFQDIPRAMEECIAGLNQNWDVHPVLQAASLYLSFMRILPFTYGNGRTARAIMLLYLYRNNYAFGGFFAPERAFVKNDGSIYSEKLHLSMGQSYGETYDPYPFISFYIDSIFKTAAEVYKLVSMPITGGLLGDDISLDPKEITILQYIQQYGLVGISEYVRTHDITYKEALLLFSRLRSTGYIERIGMGKSTRYILRKKE